MSQQQVPPSTFYSILKDCALGGAAQGIGRTLTAPIDRFEIIKLHREHGMSFHYSKFWLGNLVRIIKSFLPNTVVFNIALKDSIKRLFLPKYSSVDEFGKFMMI